MHVLPQFPYYGDRKIVGGYAAATLCLTSAQTEAGLSPSVVARVLPSTPSTTYAGAPIVAIGDTRSAGHAIGTISFMIRALWHIIRNRQSMDVIHVHAGYAEYLCLGVMARVLSRRPVVQTLYCPPRPGGVRRVVQAVMALAASRLSILSAVSANVAAEIQRLPLQRRNAPSVVGIAVDTDYWQSTTASSAVAGRTESDRLNILFVGNATPEKNLRSLIQAGSILKERGIHFRIRATTELERSSSSAALAELAELAASLGISDELELGSIVDMRHVVTSADVHVAPFVSTQGPSDYFVSSLEAMSAGKPVISSSLPGMSEVIVDGCNGFLVEPYDVDGLARVLMLLRDPSTREMIGENARATIVERFSPAVVATRMRCLYECG